MLTQISSAPARPSGHRPQLDGLRALAVGGVLLTHTIPWLPFRFDVGAASVRLFFALSGFLVTGILLRARTQADSANGQRGHILLAFYARRFLRIFPLYYGVLIVAAILDLPQVRETLGWHVSYLSNLFAFFHQSESTPAYLNHLWSLAVEEQFYLVWPMVVLFAPLRRLPMVMLAAVALAPFSRLLFAAICPSSAPVYGGSVMLTSCLDALGGGALLAVIWEAGSAAVSLRVRVRRWSLGLGGGLLAVIMAFSLLRLDWGLGVAFKHLGYALLSFWLVDRAAEGFGGVGRLLESRPMTYIGGISYGIYIYHEFVPALVEWIERRMDLTLHFPGEGGILRFLCVVGVTIPVAALSWQIFEKPLNDLKSRFPYLRKKTQPAEAIKTRAVGSSAVA